MNNKNTCDWAKNELAIKYHDEIWGIPEYHDDKLFYMLILEGMQAGLSWDLILKKWQAFFLAFDNFNINKIAEYNEQKIDNLMQNPNIIRNRRKLTTLAINAKAYLTIQQQAGTFANFIWHYVDNTPIINYWQNSTEIPSSTKLAQQISRDLKKYGFKFVGETIIYAYMQAIGMVNDHLIYCHKHPNNQTEIL